MKVAVGRGLSRSELGIALILVAALTAGALGCNGSSSPTDSNATASQASASSTPDTPPKPVAEATKPSADVTKPVADATKPASVDPSPQTNIDPRTGTDPNRINQLKNLKIVIVKAKGHKIKAWVMDNGSKRQEGMMFLEDKDVRSDEGMLFVFPMVQPGDLQHGFWMQNCPLGLDICFIGSNKKVLNIADGKPWNTTNLPPAGPYLYVLEMKTNCAKKLGIKAGTKIEIPNGLPSTPDPAH
jgi:uncharacterized membrane protein (UPF0127 family)